MGHGWNKFTDGFISFVAPEISDSIIERNSEKIQGINNQMEKSAESFRSKVQKYLHTVQALHDRQLQMDAIMWTPANISAPHFTFPKMETFDTTPYEITEDVIRAATPAISMALTVIPGGAIFGLVMPMIGNGIVAAVKTGESDDAVFNAESNQRKLNSSISSYEKQLSANEASIKKINSLLDDFQKKLFSELQVHSWSDVLNLKDNTYRFSIDVTHLGSVRSLEDASRIAQNLSDSKERDAYLNLFNSKQDLVDHINQVNGGHTQTKSRVRRSLYSASSKLDPQNVTSSGNNSSSIEYDDSVEQYVLQSAKNNLHLLLLRLKSLLQDQFNLLFAAYLGITYAAGSSLQNFYVTLSNELTGLLNETKPVHASIIHDLSVFDAGAHWSAHRQKVTTALQNGSSHSLGIRISNHLHGAVPLTSTTDSHADVLQSPYDWLNWKRDELTSISFELTRIEKSLSEVRSNALSSMIGHESDWLAIGRQCEELDTVLSHLATVGSHRADGEAGDVIRHAVNDEAAKRELQELATLRDMYEDAVSHIHLSELN